VGRWNVSGTWSSAFQRAQKLTITEMRTIFDCGCHLRFLTATVSRLADASGLATRPWHPGLIDGRRSPYAAVQSTICELDTPRLLWTTDCDIPTVSVQKRAVDSEVSSIRQLAYRDFTFLNSWKQLLGANFSNLFRHPGLREANIRFQRFWARADPLGLLGPGLKPKERIDDEVP